MNRVPRRLHPGSKVPEAQFHHYLISALTVLIATVIHETFRPVFVSVPFLLFWLSVTFSAWFSGFVGGLLATTLSVVLVNLFFQPPFYRFSRDRNDLFALLLFFIVSTVINALITKQRARMAQAAATEQFLTLLIESATDYAIFSTNHEGDILTWSEGAEHLFGYPGSSIIGQNVNLLFTPEDRVGQEARKEREQARRRGYAEDERWHLRQDGSRFYASGRVRPIVSNDQVVGFIKVARDITEAKKAEEERAALLVQEMEARTRAEAATASRVQFTGMIAHELRNPLTAIKGFVSTLRATDVQFSEAQTEEFLALIEEETDRLTELVDQLLDTTLVQTGTLRIHPECTSLVQIILIGEARMRAVTAGRELVVDIPTGLSQVHADPQRIAQVVINLVANAAKFSPTNTPIRIQAHQVGGYVQVEVIDQGPGIPPEKHEAIFAAFERLEQGQTGRQKGLGLGLAICKGLVEAHGGKIWVEKTAQPGTVIVFTLPIEAAPCANSIPATK